MDFREIRNKFLDYFKAQDHEIVSSSSLIPRDDPSLLFTNAGMVQFKALFLGEETRSYTRAATSQKCVRAGGKHNDLDNVGYTARHHTFFEMLGNFSFGDYFKEEAILWAWDLLIEGYGLPGEKMWISVYKDDDEAFRIWEKEIGIPADRIVRLGEKDNFWAMGDTGPCGPCSEILIDQGESVGCGRPECAPGCDCDRYLEIWNLVFTQFDRDPDGTLHPLPKPNIDTGMGLERLAAVVQGVTSNYETDLFRSVIVTIEELAGAGYGEDAKRDVAFRVIADHARAAAFLIGDGVLPSNEGRGYVLRRIIRRAIRFGQTLGFQDPFLHRVAEKVIDIMGRDYEELVTAHRLIDGVILNEEKRFADTLYYGMRVLEEYLEGLKAKEERLIPGELAFKLYDTYGLSLDIVEDVAREEGLAIDLPGYEQAMARQRTQSQESWKGSGEEEMPEAYRRLMAKGVSTAFMGYETLEAEAKVSAIIRDGREVPEARQGDDIEVVLDRTPFYGEAGGQVGDRGWIVAGDVRMTVSDTFKAGQDIITHRGRLENGALSLGATVRALVDEQRRKATALNHTATHLLHKALREILGDHVKQAGSLVTPERFRFDFSHFTQVDREKLKEVEGLVNDYIRENLPLSFEEMSREEAMKTGAIAIFEERYGETVRLVRIGDGLSMELCGGTHTTRTGNIGLFKIAGESAVGANVRRIEALTGKAALEYVQDQEEDLRHIATLLKSAPDQAKDKAERLVKDIKQKEREIEQLKARLLTSQSVDLLAGVKEIDDTKVLVREVKADSPKALREFADRIKDRLKSGIIVLGARNEGKALLVCVVTRDLAGRYRAGDIIKQLSEIVGGKGGGRPDMAQGGGSRTEELERALEATYDLVKRTTGSDP
ncbi:MAG: alanine--tRNA ligase [Deltaproteobacteria bacterium]|nr:alanine--tRNA ligase [Deltaproteobacteria bacterium]MBW2138177.1 alanine--tRNA ligase [Deltaproteobacteria bacterium]